MEHLIGFAALDQRAIQSSLTTTMFGRNLCILPEVSSTNSHALTLTESPSAHGTVVVAERQTAGRGRLDRTWFSPSALNLYTSVLLMPSTALPSMTWIPLIAGLALTKAIYQTCGLQASLKWPNDVLLQDRKLGGILCEGHSQGPHQQVVVIGMGLNVNMVATDFPDELRQYSTSLRIHTQTDINRNMLLAHLLNSLELWYGQLSDGHLDSIRAAYTSQCETLGRDLLVHLTNGEKFRAIGHAIGHDGALHVCLKDVPGSPVRIIHSGDVTHLNVRHA